MTDTGRAATLSVAADPSRARMLRLMLAAPEGRATVGALARELGLRQPTVSHHMAALLAAGLVVREPEGRRVWYSVHPDHGAGLRSLLGEEVEHVAAPDWERVIDDLTDRFRGRFNRETVARFVADSRELLSVRDVPLLASRTASFAAARLDDLDRADRPSGPPTVLFVCVQNAGRSQLAAAILRQLVGDRVVVRTAGSQPAPDVRPAIVAALDEIGVAVRDEFPKPLTDDAVKAADVVITMGCGDACPVYPGRRYLDWDLDDPVDRPMDVVRRIRDDIDARVRGLAAELLMA